MEEALKKEISEMLGAAVDAALKPVLTQVGQVAEAAKKFGEIEKNLDVVAKTVAGQKILSGDDVRKIVTDDAVAREQVAAKKAQEQQTAADLKAKREKFAGEKLKGVPARYHEALGDDETKWEANEKVIREQFATDAKAAGLQIPNVGGSGGGSAVTSTGTATGTVLQMAGAVK